MVTMKFEGGREMAQVLEGMSKRLQGKVLREALEDAGAPMQKSMARNAAKSDEAPHMSEHIVIGSARVKRVAASVAIGPSRDFDTRARIYPFQQEYGNAHHGPQPFARPAFNTNVQKALDTIRASFWREMAGRGISRPTTVLNGPVTNAGFSGAAGLGAGSWTAKTR